jgi:hypothetical protein
MTKALSRGQQYKDRGDECLRLSELASSDDIRRHYRTTAESYLRLAEAELKLEAETQTTRTSQPQEPRAS